MSTLIERGAKAALSAGVAALVLAGNPAWAETFESTYVAPFGGADAYLSSCEAPRCEGSSSATPAGSLAGDLSLIGGPGSDEYGQASVNVAHTVAAPAEEVTFELRAHIDEAFASAVGLLAAHGQASLWLDAWHTSCSACFAFARQPLATADWPIAEEQVVDQDVVLTATAGSGPRVIPAGEIVITVFAVVEARTWGHFPSASASPCTPDCLGAGRVEARLYADVESVRVTETR